MVAVTSYITRFRPGDSASEFEKMDATLSLCGVSKLCSAKRGGRVQAFSTHVRSSSRRTEFEIAVELDSMTVIATLTV